MASSNASDHPSTVEVIRRFLNKYEEIDYPYYENLASVVGSICKAHLRDHMYDAIVTHRAKKVESLTKKLHDRLEEDQYQNEDDIREKIADLSGVRIALFLPHQKAIVERFIENRFKIKHKINHPGTEGKKENAAINRVAQDAKKEKDEVAYQNRFKGYQATHYRVKLKYEDAGRGVQENDQIEIQLMSVLHSAWSEVEHNILYKRMKGQPSGPEISMLDGLNGLVSIGELYLEQLNQIYINRVEFEKDVDEAFANKYELGSFLSSMMRDKKIPAEEFTMSSVELLRKFLRLDGVSLDSKSKLSAELPCLNITVNRESSLQSRLPCPEKPSISLVIMESIFKKDMFKLEERARNDCKKSYSERCNIMLSTILSLDELFPPVSTWMIELNNHSKNFSDREWLMNSQSCRNILLDPGERVVACDKEKICKLWDWFQTHPSKIVRFVFSISKLGVLREFPQDFALLRKIYHTSKEYTKEEYVGLATT